MFFVDDILKWAWALFCTQLNSIAIQQSQFHISHLVAHTVCSVWPIDRTLLSAATPDLSRPRNDVNNAGLLSYTGHSVEEVYSSTQIQSVYYTAPADWACDSMKKN